MANFSVPALSPPNNVIYDVNPGASGVIGAVAAIVDGLVFARLGGDSQLSISSVGIVSLSSPILTVGVMFTMTAQATSLTCWER